MGTIKTKVKLRFLSFTETFYHVYHIELDNIGVVTHILRDQQMSRHVLEGEVVLRDHYCSGDRILAVTQVFHLLDVVEHSSRLFVFADQLFGFLQTVDSVFDNGVAR